MNPIHEDECMDECHDTPAALVARLRARCDRMARSIDLEDRRIAAALQAILDAEGGVVRTECHWTDSGRTGQLSAGNRRWQGARKGAR